MIAARRAATRSKRYRARRVREATRARPAQGAGAPKSLALLKATPSQRRPIFLPPLTLIYRRSIQPLHLGDGSYIPKRLHLVAWLPHELIGLTRMDRVQRRGLGNQAFGHLAATHTKLAALALQERVVFTRFEMIERSPRKFSTVSSGRKAPTGAGSRISLTSGRRRVGLMSPSSLVSSRGGSSAG